MRLQIVLAVALAWGCAADPDAEPIAARAGELVYGEDDRRELYDVADEGQRALMLEATVAIVPRSTLSRVGGELRIEAPSWGERAGLCPDERFADQPSAAVCTGVLVDWDLVLTAGHCVRLLALKDLAIVFDYHYAAPGALRVGDERHPVEIVAEALSPQGTSPRLDYAWLRLDRPAPSSRRPARVHVTQPRVAVGDGLLAIFAGGGVPMKLDAGGRARDLRVDAGDYFVADTDTTGGSSGGGSFDAQRALLGVLARGGADLVMTEAGCNRLVHVSADDQAEEQFTWAHQAVRGLCDAHPDATSLCRSDCGSPCEALPLQPSSSGCTIGASEGRGRYATAVALAAALTAWRRRKRCDVRS